MSAFTPFATRFSVSDCPAAKVAKVAKAQPPDAPEHSRLSQHATAEIRPERQGEPQLSQLSQLSRGRVPEFEKRPTPDRWLVDVVKSIVDALRDGAERETDADGWLLLVRPDGCRLVIGPRIVAQLHAAGLMPPLPTADAQSAYAARARPPCWSDPNDVPKEGDRCTCGGGRWWTFKPTPDGWCCVTCHPPIHLPLEAIHEVTT